MSTLAKVKGYSNVLDKASACTEEYGSWCRSYYSVSSHGCYGKAQVGGLTTTTVYDKYAEKKSKK